MKGLSRTKMLEENKFCLHYVFIGGHREHREEIRIVRHGLTQIDTDRKLSIKKQGKSVSKIQKPRA